MLPTQLTNCACFSLCTYIMSNKLSSKFLSIFINQANKAVKWIWRIWHCFSYLREMVTQPTCYSCSCPSLLHCVLNLNTPEHSIHTWGNCTNIVEKVFGRFIKNSSLTIDRRQPLKQCAWQLSALMSELPMKETGKPTETQRDWLLAYILAHNQVRSAYGLTLIIIEEYGKGWRREQHQNIFQLLSRRGCKIKRDLEADIACVHFFL